MREFAILFNGGLTWLACGIVLISLGCITYYIFAILFCKDKKQEKKGLKNSFIALLIGCFIVYLLHYAGEFRKLNLKAETVEKMLAMDITKIESGDYELELTKDKNNSKYNVYINKSVGDTSLYDEEPYYYYKIGKFFDYRFTDEDSLVVVFARSSDRDLEQIPAVQEHCSKVGIVQGDEVLEIYYWDNGNTDEILKKALDYIFEVGLESNMVNY